MTGCSSGAERAARDREVGGSIPPSRTTTTTTRWGDATWTQVGVLPLDEDGRPTGEVRWTQGVRDVQIDAKFDLDAEHEHVELWYGRPRTIEVRSEVPHDAWRFWADVFRVPLRRLVGPVPYKPNKRRYGR